MLLEDGGEVGAVLLHEIGERPEEGAEVLGAEAFGEAFDAAGHVFEFDHDARSGRAARGCRDVAAFDCAMGGGVGAALDGDEVLAHQAGEFDDGPGCRS